MNDMKIGILTFHRTSNYGTVLQAQATVIALQQMGVNAEIIDYRPEYNEKTLRVRKLSQARTIKTALSVLLNRFIYGKQIVKRLQNFQEYIDTLKVSRQAVYTEKDVCEITQDYDIILSGSDQLWNERITGEDMTYFFPFEHPYKISYASSFGVSEISENRKKEIEPLLSSFRYLSVREKTAQTMLEQFLQQSKGEVACVIDPTLLVNKRTWLDQASNSFTPPKGGYILTYYMIETPILRAITNELRKKTGLPVINLKPSKRQILLHEGLNMMWAGPREFLSCYAGAKYVVTNSFHGTAFAINFEVPMYVAPLPFSMAGEVNSRLIDILNRYGLKNRWISELDDVKHLSNAFNLDMLRQKKEQQYEESIQYLKTALGM